MINVNDSIQHQASNVNSGSELQTPDSRLNYGFRPRQASHYRNFSCQITTKINNLPASKIEPMLEEFEKKRRKQASFMRSAMDYGMGIIILLLGVVLFFHEKFKIQINERFSPNMVKLLGVLFVLYGAWRIYRGYKKNYFQ